MFTVPGFPLGLGGIMAGWTPPKPETFKDKEDAVTELLDKLDDGEQALLYKALYACGHRIGDCDPKISAMKKRLLDAAKLAP